MQFNLLRHARARLRDEAIEMRERRHGYFPKGFMWHGHLYRVHAVERCWTDLSDRRADGRLCFRVRCAEGTFEVYQDISANTWHIAQARR